MSDIFNLGLTDLVSAIGRHLEELRVTIPYQEISRATLDSHLLGSRLVIQVSNLERIERTAIRGGGRFALSVGRRDKDAAKQFTTSLNERLA